MNIHKPKQHHVWRPRMSSDSEFNPFVRSTQPEASLDHRTLEEDIEELTQDSDSESESEPSNPASS
jgi:hypothetical protein